MTQKCNKCLISKNLDEFALYSFVYKGVKKTNTKKHCIKCFNERRKRYYHANLDKMRIRGSTRKNSPSYEKHKLRNKSPAYRIKANKRRMRRTFQRIWWNLFKRHPEARKKTTITYFDFWKLAKKQKLICPLTGRKLTNETISIDHIKPIGNGGKHELDNLRLVCLDANIARNDLGDANFFQLCKDVALFNPI